MEEQEGNILIVITGPTASGKTNLAARVASRIGGEVISADSRQVYRGMDIGTGKDLGEFIQGGKRVPCHLIDIRNPGYEYNVYEFRKDFLKAYNDIVSRGKQVLLCGGTGLYIESAVAGYNMQRVPVDEALRQWLREKSMKEMANILAGLRPLHNTTDVTDRARLERAIEIAEYEKSYKGMSPAMTEFSTVIFGIAYERSILRERITRRLKKRLSEGMTGEVENLIKSGISEDKLLFYGLEYRYLTLYVTGRISYSEMFTKLNTAIHQYAKRQMTWFRRMEKNGFHIEWIDGELDIKEKEKIVLKRLESITP